MYDRVGGTRSKVGQCLTHITVFKLLSACFIKLFENISAYSYHLLIMYVPLNLRITRDIEQKSTMWEVKSQNFGTKLYGA